VTMYRDSCLDIQFDLCGSICQGFRKFDSFVNESGLTNALLGPGVFFSIHGEVPLGKRIISLGRHMVFLFQETPFSLLLSGHNLAHHYNKIDKGRKCTHSLW
jgi:hypothetical protein